MKRKLSVDGLTLRPLVARDAGELFLLCDQHRTVLRRTMTWVDKTMAIADMSFYIASLDGFWKTGLTYGILEDETLIGTVGFHETVMRNRKTEIGYWLAPPYHGRGIATRAIKCAIDAAFLYTDINRIQAKIQPTNLASLKVIKKLGFSYEGLEREGVKTKDSYWDHKVFSLLRGDLGPSEPL